MHPFQTFGRGLRVATLALMVSTSASGLARAQPSAILPDNPAPVPAETETAAAPPGLPTGMDAIPAAPCPPAAAPPAPKWVTPFPRLGYFVVPPTGAGYYSLLDHLRGDERQAPPKYPYPRFGIIPQSYYDVNWSYLKDPKNTDHDYADCLKWMPVADGITFTTGGEFRSRYMQEVNSNNRLSGRVDAYNLFRTRVYGDLWVEDWLRVYAEFLYADYVSRSLTPLATDADRGDLLNLFADLRVFQFGEKDNPVYLRVGRQELLYGSQRLISPLDWVNTRRTFQGAKLFTRTEKWDFDVFAVQPVVPQAGRFDSVDNNRFFSGAWFTYRPQTGQNIDLYYLNLDNTNPGAAVGLGGVPGAYNVNTVGTRYVGTAKNWLWDSEAMLQFGGYSNQAILAKSFAVEGGYQFKDLPWQPQFWAGYEYASGDPDPQVTGTRRTFNQLFPFAHYYFGYTDLVGRQNINDYFLQGVVFPAKWLTCIAQYHVFRLDSDKDALYAANGSVVRQDRTGRAGNDVGNELDLRGNVHVSKHTDVLFGYSRLFAGSFIKNTSPPGPRQNALNTDPELFYLQYSYRW